MDTQDAKERFSKETCLNVMNYGEQKIKTFCSFRNLIYDTLGYDALNYLDDSTILIMQQIESLISKFDALVNDDHTDINFIEYASLVDELNKLRLDLYRERLM